MGNRLSELNKNIGNEGQAIIKLYEDNADNLIAIIEKDDIFFCNGKQYKFDSISKESNLISANLVDFNYETLTYDSGELKHLLINECSKRDDDASSLAYIDEVCIYKEKAVNVKSGIVDGRWEHDKLTLIDSVTNEHHVVELSNIITTERILKHQADIICQKYGSFYITKGSDYLHGENNVFDAILRGKKRTETSLSVKLIGNKIIANLSYSNVYKAVIEYNVSINTSCNNYYDKVKIEKVELIKFEKL